MDVVACSGAQDNRLSGGLDEYATALRSSVLPSSTRYLGLGGNQLTGAVPQAIFPPLFLLGALPAVVGGGFHMLKAGP